VALLSAYFLVARRRQIGFGIIFFQLEKSVRLLYKMACKEDSEYLACYIKDDVTTKDDDATIKDDATTKDDATVKDDDDDYVCDKTDMIGVILTIGALAVGLTMARTIGRTIAKEMVHVEKFLREQHEKKQKNKAEPEEQQSAEPKE
jgi:hypothetical protein